MPRSLRAVRPALRDQNLAFKWLSFHDCVSGFLDSPSPMCYCRDGCNRDRLEVCSSSMWRHIGCCQVSAQCSLGPPGPSPAEQVPACTMFNTDPTSSSCFVRVIPLPQGLGRPSQLGRAGQTLQLISLLLDIKTTKTHRPAKGGYWAEGPLMLI